MEYHEEPTIVWRREHVSGFFEIGIGYKNRIVFYITDELTPSAEKMKKKPIEIDGNELMKIKSLAKSLKIKMELEEFCFCGREAMGIDRGIPLCEAHWDQQCEAAEKDEKKYNKTDTTTINIENKNAYEILFDL